MGSITIQLSRDAFHILLKSVHFFHYLLRRFFCDRLFLRMLNRLRHHFLGGGVIDIAILLNLFGKGGQFSTF